MDENLVAPGFDLSQHPDTRQGLQVCRRRLPLRDPGIYKVVDPAIGLLKDCLHKFVAIYLRQLVPNESLIVPKPYIPPAKRDCTGGLPSSQGRRALRYPGTRRVCPSS